MFIFVKSVFAKMVNAKMVNSALGQKCHTDGTLNSQPASLVQQKQAHRATLKVKITHYILAAAVLAVSSVASAQEITGFSKKARNVNDPTGATINNLTSVGDVIQRYIVSFSCTGATACTINLKDDIAGMTVNPAVYPGQPSVLLLSILDTNMLADPAQITASVTAQEIDLDLVIPAGGSYELIYRVRIYNQRHEDGTTFKNSATITATAPTTISNDVVTTAEHTATLEAGFTPRAVKTANPLIATGNRRARYTVQACSDGIPDMSEIIWENGKLSDTLPAGTEIVDLNGWTLIEPIPADGTNTTTPVKIEFTTPTPRFGGCYVAPAYEVFYSLANFPDGAQPTNTVVFTGNAFGEPAFTETATSTVPPLESAPTGTELSGIKAARFQSPNAPVLDIVPTQSVASLTDGGVVNSYYFPFTLLNTEGNVWEVVIDDAATLAGATADFFNFNEVIGFGFSGATVDDYEFTVMYTTAEIGAPTTTSGPTMWARCPIGDGGSSDGWCKTRTGINIAVKSGGSGTVNIPANHYVTSLQFRVRAFNFQDDPRAMGDSYQTENLTGLFFNALPRATSLADGSSLPSDPTEMTNCANFKGLGSDLSTVATSSSTGGPLDAIVCDQMQIQGERYGALWTDYANVEPGPFTVGNTATFNVRVLDQSPLNVPISDPPTVRLTDPVVQVELAPSLLFDSVLPHSASGVATAPENATLPTCNVIASVGFPARQILECTWPAGTGLPTSAGIQSNSGLGFRVSTTVGATAQDGVFRQNVAATATPNAAVIDNVRCNRTVYNTTDALVFTSGEAGFNDVTGGAFEFREQLAGPGGYLDNSAITSFACKDPVDVTFENAGAFLTTKLVSPGNIGQVANGITRPGEASSWNLIVQNTSTDSVDSLLVYDKLPFVGDTSIFTGDARDSEFIGPLTGPATNTVTTAGVPVIGDPAVLVEYSFEETPCFDDPVNLTLAPSNRFISPVGCIPNAFFPEGIVSLIGFDSVRWIKVTRVIDDDLATADFIETDLPADTILQIELPFLTPTNRVGGDRIANDFSTASDAGRLDSQVAVLLVADGEISNRVFLDTNADGLQDTGDLPVAGVTVTLETTTGDAVLQPDGVTPYSTTTNSSGDYLFDRLAIGNYVAVFDWSTATGLPAGITPATLQLTTLNEGTDTTIDSDGVAVMGQATQATAAASLTADANGLPINNPDVDIGLTLPSDLQVIKTVAGVASNQTWSFDFTLTGGPATGAATQTSSGMGENPGTAASWTGLISGTTYTLTETLNNDYAGGTLECRDLTDTVISTNLTPNSVTFVAPTGDASTSIFEVNCSITNTALTSDIQVEKTVQGFGPEAISTDHDWNFVFTLSSAADATASGTGNDTDAVNWGDLIPGTEYVLSETAQTGYTEGALICNDDSGSSVDTDNNTMDLSVTFIAPFGDGNHTDDVYDINCIITNTADTVAARVTKTVSGVDDDVDWEFDFTITPTSAADPMVDSGDNNVSTTGMGSTTSIDTVIWTELLPGAEYTIAEQAETGYTLGTLTCTGLTDSEMDKTDASITFIAPLNDGVDGNFEVDCSITNTPLAPDLRLTKTVETNADEDWSFNFTLNPTATTTDMLPIMGNGSDVTEITWSALIPGTTYTISEVTAGLTGYTAGTMMCSSLENGQLVALTDLETNQTDASFQFMAPLGDENSNGRTFEIECEIINQQWPDLVVTKTVDPAAAKAGDPVTFTVGVTNQGILPATEVELTDILPDGLVYVDPNPTPSQGTYTSADGIWDVGELAGSGEGASLEFATTIEPVAGECEVDYTNAVSVTNQLETDFDTTNHSAEAMCQLVSVALAKQHVSSTAVGSGEVGDFRYQVVYELLAVNNGGVDLTNVQIIDDLNQIINDPNTNDAIIVPGTASVASVGGVPLTPNPNYDGINDANLLTGNDSLAAGSEATITITFEMLVDVYFGDFTNQATITAMAGDVAVEDLSEDGATVTNGSRLFSANAVTNDAGCVQDSPTVFRLNIPATPATINWFKANDLGGIVAFDWTSGAEIANAGFIIEAQDEEGSWNPVSELIPSQGDATVEQHYQHEVVTSATVFRLVDVDISGKRTEHGPYELDTDYGQRSPRKATDWDAIEQDSDAARETREQRLREQLREKLQQSAPTTYWFRAPQSEPATPVLEENRMQPTNTQPDSWLSRVKTGAVGLLALGLNSLVPSAHALDVAALDIHTSGVYKVRHQDLLNAGIDLSGISKNQIGIRHVEHGSVPVKVTGGSNFGNNGTITFAAYDLTTTYVDKNTYVLTVNEGQVEIGTDDGAIPNGPAAYSYLAHKRHAPQNHYSHTSPDRHDAWYAESLKAISRPASTDITLEVDGYAPVVGSTSSTGSGAQSAVARPTLQLDLWGASNPKGDGVANPDHHVTVDLNGERIQDIRFDGLQVKQTEQVLDNLASGTQSITLSLPKSHGYAFDFVRLDEIAISYPRKFWAEQSKHLVFDSEWNKFLVRKLNSETNVEVYRMNAQGDVDQITQTQGKGCTNGQCRVMFKGADEKGQLHRYFVSSAPRTPGIRLVDPDMAPIAGQVDHILIAHSDFINNSQLQAYANQLQANGDTVEIVDVAGIYARYTGHIVDASAIQAYIQEAYELRGTRNISLIGDDNYDYHNNLGTNAQSFIPSLYVRIAQNVNAVPSDPKYADIDDDNIPDLGITRLPVRSNTELNRILAKHSAYQNRSYSNKTLFAADEQENSGYSFKADAEAIKASFNGWQASTAYMDDMTPTQASQTVVNQINQGVSLTHYFGHGNTDRWGRNDALLVGEQVGNLINQGKPTVVLQWACWNNFYVNPQEDALGHRFLTESENGAVTVMGATSLTTADAEQALAQKLYAHLHQGKSIAKAVLDAKRELAQDRPHQLDILLGWTTLGPADMVVSQ